MHCERRGSEKSTFLAIFWGFLISQERLLFRNSTRKTFKFDKSLIFTNTPCKSTCLYNAPSLHTVENTLAICNSQRIIYAIVWWGEWELQIHRFAELLWGTLWDWSLPVPHLLGYACALNSPTLKDGDTKIKFNLCSLDAGWAWGGREQSRPKNSFLLGKFHDV